MNNSESTPKVKKETKNKIRVDFDRTPLLDRLKAKFINLYTVKKIVWYLFRFVLLLGISYVILFPFFSKIASSFMSPEDFVDVTVRLIPKNPTLETYKAIIVDNQYFTAMFNSFILSLTCALLQTFMSCLIGYGLAKFKFKGRNLVFISIMATMMIPFEAIMIPLYMVTQKFGMINTYPGMIVPFLVSAFGVFQMRQYLLTFPSEYLDAARVDGLGEFNIYARIVLPNSTPVIATLSILSFRNQWDNLLWPLLVAQQEKMKTIPQYITKFSEEKLTDEGAMMAVALLASIPMFVLFFSLSRYFLGGAAVYESRKG